MTDSPEPKPPRGFFHRLLWGASALVVLTFLLFPSVTVLEKSHYVGYAICHQLPARTFHLDGHPLPLCARCTGIYLGALTAFVTIFLFKRQRAIYLPPPVVLFPLICFTFILGIDGINSYITFFPNAPHLYEPQNWLRLTTGAFHGVTMMLILYPVVSESLWEPGYGHAEPVVGNLKEFLFFLIGPLVVIGVVLKAQGTILLYVLTVLSSGGVVLMLSMINTVFALFLTRQIGRARSWLDVLYPWLIGLAAGLLMLGGMVWVRTTLVRLAGLPL